jgi:uncharacterized DUF497 family protein
MDNGYTQKERLGGMEARFDWNEANTAHIARHGITPSEAEQVVSGAALPIETEGRGGEERYTELGETASGRLLGRMDVAREQGSSGDCVRGESKVVRVVAPNERRA